MAAWVRGIAPWPENMFCQALLMIIFGIYDLVK
jgi:hypothetical protein